MPLAEGAARLIVYARSHGRCELCGRPAQSVHHRMKEGRPWDPANLLHICGDGTRYCHGWIELHPAHAMTLGLWLRRGTDYTRHPAWMHPTSWYQDWWTLDNDGMLGFVHHTHPDPAAARVAQQAFADARGLGLVLPP